MMKVLKIWAILLSAYAGVVAILTLAPLLGSAVVRLTRWLDAVTHGYATSTLVVFVTIGSAATLVYLAQAIRVRAMRRPPSAVHICASTMFSSIFGGKAEQDAREILASFRAPLEPHIILMEPSDKGLSGVFVKEVKS